MTDKVENSLINTSYKYKDTELSVYDTDQDGEISIFEIEQIEDEDTKLALVDTLETSKRKEEVTDEKLLNAVHQAYDNREEYITAMKKSQLNNSIEKIVALIEEAAKKGKKK